MKKLILVIGFVSACGSSVPYQDIVIGTNGIESTWDKAVSDVRNEYDRTESRVEDTLYKANMDVVNEEHRVNENVKEAGAKANADTLDALKKANMDAVAEEHRVNQNVKDTGLKANEDFNHEQDRMTERLVGSDDTRLDEHDRRIAALEEQAAFLAGELDRTTMLESQVAKLSQQDQSLMQAMQDGLAETKKDIAFLMSKIGSLSVADIVGLSNRLTTLEQATHTPNVCTFTAARSGNVCKLTITCGSSVTSFSAQKGNANCVGS